MWEDHNVSFNASSHFVTTQENYKKAEEGGVGSDISDSLNNVDDIGAFPSVFSFWTKFWLVLLVLSVSVILYLIYLSFIQEKVTTFFIFNIITGIVTLMAFIMFIKSLFRDRHREEKRIADEIQRIRRIDERRLLIEENRRHNHRIVEASSSLEL